MGLHLVGDRARDAPLRDHGGVAGDGLQRPRQLALHEAVAALLRLKEDARGLGVLEQSLTAPLNALEVAVAHGKPRLGGADGGGDQAGPRQATALVMQRLEARHGARHRHRQPAVDAALGHRLAPGVEVHVAGRGPRRHLAVVEGLHRRRRRVPMHGEAAAADARREGLDDADHERRRDGRVGGVATLLQDLERRRRRQWMRRRRHSRRRRRRMWRRGLQRQRQEQQND